MMLTSRREPTRRSGAPTPRREREGAGLIPSTAREAGILRDSQHNRAVPVACIPPSRRFSSTRERHRSQSDVQVSENACRPRAPAALWIERNTGRSTHDNGYVPDVRRRGTMDRKEYRSELTHGPVPDDGPRPRGTMDRKEYRLERRWARLSPLSLALAALRIERNTGWSLAPGISRAWSSIVTPWIEKECRSEAVQRSLKAVAAPARHHGSKRNAGRSHNEFADASACRRRDSADRKECRSEVGSTSGKQVTLRIERNVGRSEFSTCAARHALQVVPRIERNAGRRMCSGATCGRHHGSKGMQVGSGNGVLFRLHPRMT